MEKAGTPDTLANMEGLKNGLATIDGTPQSGAATKIAMATSSDISDIKKRLADEEKKRVHLEKDMAILKKKMEVMEYSLEHQNATIDAIGQKETVYFIARLTRDYKFKGREIVCFDQVLVNVGGGYNAASGVFTVPVTGVYLITCSLSINSDYHKCKAYLKRNAHEIRRVKLSCDRYNWCRDCVTISLPISLAVGDKIYLEAEKRTEGDELSSLSAVLLK